MTGQKIFRVSMFNAVLFALLIPFSIIRPKQASAGLTRPVPFLWSQATPTKTSCVLIWQKEEKLPPNNQIRVLHTQNV